MLAYEARKGKSALEGEIRSYIRGQQLALSRRAEFIEAEVEGFVDGLRIP